MDKQQWIETDFCTCDHDRPWTEAMQPNVIDDILRCTVCNKPVQCEFSDLSDDPSDPDADGTPHAAQTIHIDYRICRRHLSIAVDNVMSRTMP